MRRPSTRKRLQSFPRTNQPFIIKAYDPNMSSVQSSHHDLASLSYLLCIRELLPIGTHDTADKIAVA
jgi:hypothetical protein